MGSQVAEHIIVALLLTPMTIVSIIVVYKLFSHLCCISPRPPKEVSSPSISNIDANSTGPKSDINSSQTQSTESNQIGSFFRNATITGCILFCGVCLFTNIHRILLIFNITEHIWIGIFIYLFWFVGRMLLIVIFIATLSVTFKGSIFAYSKRTMAALGTCWASMPIFAVLSILLWFVSRILMVVCAVFFILIDILLSFILLYLYLKQLFHLIAGDHQIFISVFVRYTLLYLFCFISSITVFVLFGLIPVFQSENDDNYGRMLFVFISIDSLINTLSLWLKLKCAQKWYNKLCNVLHYKMMRCCNYFSASNDEQMIIMEVNEEQKQQQKPEQQKTEQQQKIDENTQQNEQQNIDVNLQQNEQQKIDENTQQNDHQNFGEHITVQTETQNTAIIM